MALLSVVMKCFEFFSLVLIHPEWLTCEWVDVDGEWRSQCVWSMVVYYRNPEIHYILQSFSFYMRTGHDGQKHEAQHYVVISRFLFPLRFISFNSTIIIHFTFIILQISYSYLNRNVVIWGLEILVLYFQPLGDQPLTFSCIPGCCLNGVGLSSCGYRADWGKSNNIIPLK